MTADGAGTECTLAVVVPVRDREALVEAAVRSVLSQHRPGVRVVVVDDGSQVPVAETLPPDPRVDVLRIDAGGVARARNAGVGAATGAAWIAFLDSDDVALDGWVEALTCGTADAALVSCRARYEWDDGTAEIVGPAAMWRAPDAPAALFLAGTFAVRRTLFLEAGGYRADLRHGENTDLGWRLSALVRRSGATVVAVDRPLVRVNARRAARNPAVLFESASMILADPPEMLIADRATYASYHAIGGVAASRLGRRRDAVRLLWRAVRLQPGDPRHLARLIRALVARGAA